MGTADTAVAVCWIGGLVSILVGFGLGGTVACSDAGYHGEPPGGVEFVGYEDGRLLYTPDGGVNTCTVPAVILLAPLGLLLIVSGGGILWRTSLAKSDL
ncbi:hypothetical protein BRC94_02670 [Halobacteriales archaeon QS_5_70_17]|jgi:hypothetical protein|nr:MAG: hypothetical protein BRC94_02670 [Halobacteriales archaeon QS_5_70_17]